MQRRFGLDLEVPDEFGYWSAGFTDGEGCFQAHIKKNRKTGRRELTLRFEIGLRADDEPTLKRFQDMLGIGKIMPQKAGRANWNPQIRYSVWRIADLYHVIVPLFERYPLYSKKAKDFAIWKTLVAIKYQEGGRHCLGGRLRGSLPTPECFWDKVVPLVKELKEQRKFNLPSQSPGELS